MRCNNVTEVRWEFGELSSAHTGSPIHCCTIATRFDRGSVLSLSALAPPLRSHPPFEVHLSLYWQSERGHPQHRVGLKLEQGL